MSFPETPTCLYWSIRGEVACMNHVPDGERRTAEGWKAIPETHSGDFQCQHCAPDHVALAQPRKDASASD
jgi:hypothetical protein